MSELGAVADARTRSGSSSAAAFGQHLMPILAENGIDPEVPGFGGIELIMTPA
jgi:hypothetical protein